VVSRQTRAHHQVGATPLLAVRHLSGDQRRNLGRCHPATPSHAELLNVGGCGHHHNKVRPAVAAGFQKQRDVENHERFAGSPGTGKETCFFGTHHRVQDAFEPVECRRIGDNHLSQLGAVDCTVTHCAGKGRIDRAYRPPATRLQPMDDRVGIKDRNARASKNRRRGRFTHANAARQADHPHGVIRSAST
jgi:hypothetical protein